MKGEGNGATWGRREKEDEGSVIVAKGKEGEGCSSARARRRSAPPGPRLRRSKSDIERKNEACERHKYFSFS